MPRGRPNKAAFLVWRQAISDLESANFSETAASNNAATPNGWPEGQAPSTVNDCSREFMASMKREWNRSHGVKTSTGSANAYVVTYDTAPAALANGQQHSFVASFANTATATANINSLGAKTIKKHGGAGLTAISSGDIQIGHHVHLEYDLSADVYVLLTPTATAAGTGTIASQNSDNVSITGGSITGITDLAVADGGTGRSTLTAHGVLVGNGTSGINATTAGTAGQVLTSNGAASDPTFQTFSGQGTWKKQVFTSSGTYTPTTGMTYCVIECVGSGGGGGGCKSSGTKISVGGGGGSGGYSRLVASAATIGASQTVTVGSAGAAGNGNSATDGGNGGDVSVGALCIGKGGTGGSTGGTSGTAPSGQGTNGGAGGIAGTGDLAVVGNAGGPGTGFIDSGGGFFVAGGYGAGSYFGGGATSGGNNGGNYGAGGAGAAGNGTITNGGVGSKGVVFIYEFCSV